ncbi:SDR family NAD(P)-dependent oxidoreductase [Hansschlegelia sp.]|uniref:SDR family NAD(P)-dependent oxidoreductase n=1 Tax=Hansschlegelia sp. TaxID=2041892 RepID=UPI002CA3DC4F|nr:SDR family NAD(P)-dependent oxidoreductase [Hansschlegelia sp.]HVI29424.1 SDR family NAD(P)-dependent oxidoreductase [Hansschlegelia sp.]
MKKTPSLAIVGRSCRLPGANDVESFWSLLSEGRCAVTSVGEDRWNHARYLHPRKGEPGKTYTFAAGVLDDIWGFDPAAFGISPREAEQMDPQQRLSLQLVWEALEDAGIPPSSIAGSETGVYVGTSSLDYGNRIIFDPASADAYFATGNTLSIVSNRISYIYDLHGPSFTVDTACSSSLVALNEAVAALKAGRIERAIVVGVSILASPFPFITFAQATMLSPRGRCHAFDASGDGYVRSEGGVAIVLERADLARAAKRPMRLMIAASAVNSDGRTVGMSLPSSEAQLSLLERVYQDAGVDPDSIAFIEAHGTGTRVGDPAEANAIGAAVKRRTVGPLPIGSVKTNVGHLEPASGLVGLLKTDLALEHDLLPASLHVTELNPDIPFDALKLHVATSAVPLPRGSAPRYAGVNSFGFGGTNAHVIVCDPTPEDRSGRSAPRVVEAEGHTPVLALSARTREALSALAGTYAKLLEGREPAAARHIAKSVAATRDLLPRRLVLESDDPSTWAATLAAVAEGGEAKDAAIDGAVGRDAPVAFAFSGNGSQWAGMGRKLHARNAAFRQKISEIDARFGALAKWSIADALFADDLPDRLRRAETAQPLMFAVQVATTAALAAEGVTPDMVLGHSVGEVAAAAASGALTLDQAVSVVHSRSVHQEIAWKNGTMAAVLLPAEEVTALLRDGGFANVEIAAINSERSITISGPESEIKELSRFARTRRVPVRVLDIDYPFHTGLIDAVKEPLLADLAGLQPGATQRTFVSSVTGGVIDGAELGADYWWENVRRPVRFADAVAAAVEEGARVFVEIGPRPVLQTYLSDCLAAAEVTGGVLSCDDHGAGEHDPLRRTLARVIAKGGRVERDLAFGKLDGSAVRLPTYPWQNTDFAVGATAEAQSFYRGFDPHPLIGSRLRADSDEWTSHLDPAVAPLLADHKVSGRVIVPGAALAEMALAAGRGWLKADIVELSDFEIPHALTLDPDAMSEVRTRVSPESRTVEILSRPRLRDDGWVVHAIGRVSAPPTIVAETPATPAHEGEIFRAADLYGRAEAHGLGFGPAFQVVDHVTRYGPNRLSVRLRPVEDRKGERDERYGLHPADFDSCFHALLTLFGVHGDRPDVTYLPMRFGSLRLLRPGATIAGAEIVVRRLSPRSIDATFTILGPEGEIVAVLADARFRAVTLSRRTPLERLSYHYAPALVGASEHASAPAPTGEELAARAAALGLAAAGEAERPEDDLLLEAFAVAAAHESLSAILGRKRQGAVADLIKRGRLAAASAPLAYSLLGLLEHQGHASLDGDVWTLAAKTGLPPSAEIIRAILADYPDRGAECVLATRAAVLLPKALTEGPLASPYGASTLAHAGSAAPLVAAGAAAVAEMAADLVAQSPAGRPIRILEIGAGSGALTRRLAPLAGDPRVTLLVTDPDATAAERLRFAFAGEPNVAVEQFDLASDGVDVGRFDLAVGSLAWGSAVAAADAMRRLGARIADGGCLVLAALAPTPFLDVVFGVQTDWFGRSASPEFPIGGARSSVDWTADLGDARLADQAIAPVSGARSPTSLVLAAKRRRPIADSEPAAHVAPVVLTAEAAGAPEGLSLAIARAIEGLGRPVTVHQAPASGVSRPNGKTNGHAHGEQGWAPAAELGLRAPAKGATGASADVVAVFDSAAGALSTATANRAGRLLSLARTVHDVSARLWVVAPGSLAGGVGAGEDRPEQAALAGFLRVVRNELRGVDIRLLDVSSDLNPEEAARAVAAELAAPKDDVELAITADGVLAPRLRPGLPEFPTPASEVEAPRVAALESGRDGGLDDLSWVAAPALDPAQGEVAIDVSAVGLNFRDVMWALGLLPEEALEDGFAGPGLGIECAGVVTAVGPGVKRYRVGDRVVAFASGAFASRVVTSETAVAPLPDSINFEEGATIPVCFLTAYYALQHLAQLRRGEWVLIHGGAGGVGLAALQIALWKGAKVIATAGSDEKRDLLRALGATHVLSSRSLEFVDEVKKLTGGEGVDVVLNSLFGEAMERSLSVLRPFGRFLELGKRDYYANSRLGLRPFRRNISYFGIDADQLLIHRGDLGQRLFGECMKLFGKGVFAPLPYRAYEPNEIRDAFRLMQQSGHVGKIVVRPLDPSKLGETKPPAFRAAEGAHVLIGGLGGFGLATAEWLVANGAEKIALIGRSGASTQAARDGVARIEAAGAKVKVFACDAADAAALEKALDETRRDLGPIGGAWHVAMVLDDALLANLDEARFEAVLKPKIDGAHALDRLTRQDPVKQFVVYSSATTLIGNPGQSNYVAANMWLESLMRVRRREGLAGLAIAWGALGDVGYLARTGEVKEKIQKRLGYQTLSGAEALEGLGRVLAHDDLRLETAVIAIAPLDWGAARRDLAFLASPMFAQVVAGAEMGPQDSVETIDLAALVRGKDAREARDIVAEILAGEVGRILKLPSKEISPQRPLAELGMDSLMGLELRMSVERRFDIELPLVAIGDSTTLTTIAQSIVSRIHEPDAGAESGSVNADLVNRHIGDDVAHAELAEFSEAVEARRATLGHVTR